MFTPLSMIWRPYRAINKVLGLYMSFNCGMHLHVAEHCHGSCGWGNGGMDGISPCAYDGMEATYAPTTRGSLHGRAST